MKLIINTSLDPEFCALFDEANALIEKVYFTDRRQTGKIIWDLLDKQDLNNTPLAFISGISGPGSFSSLRTTAGILNTLSLRFDVPVYQVRADIIAKALIETNTVDIDTFVLNSFGTSIFYLKGEELIREELAVVTDKFKNKIVCTSFLPKEKASVFKNRVNVDVSKMESLCLRLLEVQSPRSIFEPDYIFPAV